MLSKILILSQTSLQYTVYEYIKFFVSGIIDEVNNFILHYIGNVGNDIKMVRLVVGTVEYIVIGIYIYDRRLVNDGT